MNKSEFVKALAASHFNGNKKAAAKALDAVLDTIVEAVSRGEKVSITGFGVFEKRLTEQRTAVNPATGSTVRLKRQSVPAFRAGNTFTSAVGGAKAAKAAAAGTKRRASGGKAAARRGKNTLGTGDTAWAKSTNDTGWTRRPGTESRA